jgi:hypothetical protein
MVEGSRKVIEVLVLVGMLTLVILALNFTVAQPYGANVTKGASSRGKNPNPATAEAQAGNVTRLDIDQTRITDIWQGFFGNVSGEIVLENSAGDNFYDWTLGKMEGQIYASRRLIPDWSFINCTNQTQIYKEEEMLNIPNSSTDGINDTFTLYSHPNFLVGSNLVTGCRSTRPYNGSQTGGDFWNVMLSTNASNVVYTSILADNANGYDNSSIDFELLVPTDRSTGQATYYFYAELN